MNNIPPQTTQEQSVLSLIRKIHSGSLDPHLINIDDRRRCVEHLSGEGYSTAEIAEVLKASERTIARDRSAIREANAMEQDPALVPEIVGHLVRQGELAVARIRRVTRDAATPPAARIDGEKACWTIARELVDALQRLGYLPIAATEIKGELMHLHLDSLPDAAAMQEEVTRLRLIANESGIADPAIQAQMVGIERTVMRLGLIDQVEGLQQALLPPQQEGSPDDVSN